MNNSKHNKHIFISYSRQDSDFALKLAKDLCTAGVDIWMDKLDIPPGSPWDQTIEEALKQCDRLLIILSPAAVNSENVRDEIIFAVQKKKLIVPVLYRPCEIPLPLSRIQYVDCTRDYRQGLTALLANLRSAKQQVHQKAREGNDEPTIPSILFEDEEQKTIVKPTPLKYKLHISWRGLLIVSTSILVLVLIGLISFKNLALRQPTEKESQTDKVFTTKDSLYARYRDEGNVLFNQRRYEEAQSKFEAALVQKPEDEYVTSKKQDCERQINELKLGRERLYSKYKDEGDTLFSRGKYAGYFVIGFGDHNQTRALNESLRQKKNGFESQIMYSSDWSGLSPGWYIVVYGVYENRSDAENLKKTLAGRNINTYVKYSGDKISPTFNK